ncbi:PTB domain-containing engulfment adapter protein 1-like isoform X8 [Octopus vulgaris]|nr:PTB domain-containing engulfment adapter protein 1-like isoform X8 [Octopus vulgaris]
MRSQTKWVHTPESLLQGHIAYNVKFLGESEVDQPKGIEIVKDVIRKMKFNKHIKKAEGQKPPKVELTISVDGVTILDPKTKIILHQNPLHRISYCADDKSDKRMFTFIAKAADSNKHFCYVFDSEKCAKEITMTVGQAFDLAYRRFVETTGKDIDVRKQFLLLQKKVNTLQQENETLKKRIVDLENLKDKSDVDFYKSANNAGLQANSKKQTSNGDFLNDPSHRSNSPPKPLLQPPPPGKARSASTPNPRQVTSTPPVVVNPLIADSGASSNSDPFGMGDFNPFSTLNTKSNQDIDMAINNADKELLDLQTGFSRGLCFGAEDFSLDDLDPLNQKS